MAVLRIIVILLKLPQWKLLVRIEDLNIHDFLNRKKKEMIERFLKFNSFDSGLDCNYYYLFIHSY